MNNFFKNFYRLKIEVTVKTISYGIESIVKKSQVFSLNLTPRGIICTVDLALGYAMETFFMISCLPFFDPDGIVVKYEFFSKIQL